MYAVWTEPRVMILASFAVAPELGLDFNQADAGAVVHLARAVCRLQGQGGDDSGLGSVAG